MQFKTTLGKSSYWKRTKRRKKGIEKQRTGGGSLSMVLTSSMSIPESAYTWQQYGVRLRVQTRPIPLTAKKSEAKKKDSTLEGSTKVLIQHDWTINTQTRPDMKEEHIQHLQTRKRSQNGIPSSTRANRQVIGRQHWNSPCPLFRPPVRPVLSVFTVKKPPKTLKKWVRKGSVEDWEEKAERSNAVRCGRGGAAALPWLQGEWNLWPCKGKGGVFFFLFFGASLCWGFLDLSRVLGCSSDSP